MAKKGYASRQEAEVTAADWNAKRDSSKYSTALPEYEPYEHTDPVTGVTKWFIRRRPQR